jgi:hypothetical protein
VTALKCSDLGLISTSQRQFYFGVSRIFQRQRHISASAPYFGGSATFQRQRKFQRQRHISAAAEISAAAQDFGVTVARCKLRGNPP